MAHEPLQTDEKLESAVKRERDMDDHMILGCSGFLITSLGFYFLTVWPWFVFMSAQSWRTLLLCFVLGNLPALAFGTYMTRRYGLPAAGGMVGGSLAVAIFIYLRIEHAFIGGLAFRPATPDYPGGLRYLLPAVAIGAALCLAIWQYPTGDGDSTQKP